MKKKKIPPTPLAKAAAKIKVNKKLKDIEGIPPFMEKKMEMAERNMAAAGLPK